MYAELLSTARLILALEFVAFVYWVVVIGAVGAHNPETFVESIISAFHYGATFALYAGMAEIRKAQELVSSGRRDSVNVSLSNMWIALAVVALVTDCSGLASIVQGDLRHHVSHLDYRLLLSLTALLVALTVIDVVWLLALRVTIALDDATPALPTIDPQPLHQLPPPLPPSPLRV